MDVWVNPWRDQLPSSFLFRMIDSTPSHTYHSMHARLRKVKETETDMYTEKKHKIGLSINTYLSK